MTIRLKITLQIILIILTVTAGNLLSSLYFTHIGLKKTLEHDPALAAGLNEIPQSYMQNGYLYTSIFSFLIAAAAVILLSRLLMQPFQKIKSQEYDLKQWNNTFRIQTDITEYIVAAYTRNLREQEKMLEDIERRDQKLQTALTDAKEASQTKNSFLAHISHEIRTPLTAIIGFSELALHSDSLSGEAEDSLEKIHTAGKTILRIINDILDVSKMESGKFEIYPVRYDTAGLIDEIISLNIVNIGDKPITFELYADEDLPASLYGDDLRVKQVFSNLLSNAFKYTSAGTVTWRISFERDQDSIWLVSSIQDTGTGIKPENIHHLFSDYQQAHSGRNRKIEGTGLGLSITKTLVEMMGGGITVESEYEKGSVFHVRLRQGVAADTPVGKQAADQLKNFRYPASERADGMKFARLDLSYAHILLVDDISFNLDVVKGMLRPYRMKIDCAASGSQAVAMIRSASPRYSAVFMDHMMPEMDGVEATRIIREEIGTEYARKIPIIALTATAALGSEEMFLNKSFQAFISKPIDTAKLDAVLREWVQNEDLAKEYRDKEYHDKEVRGQECHDKEACGQECHGKEVRGQECHDKKACGQEVRGMDKNKALEHFNGNEALLRDIMHSYALNTRIILNNLSDFLAARDLSGYAIAVHGIKGSSYSIFAQEVAKIAESLEFAAKSDDIDAVKAGHPVLSKAVKTLCEEIEEDLDHTETIESLRFTAPEADILIAEDSETSLKGVMGLLEPLRLRIDTAANGEEALRMIQKKQYDLVFMDHMMPVMDGIEAVKLLRQMEGDYYRKVPVIALTADEIQGKEYFLQAGMNDLVNKPAQTKHLFSKIKRWLAAELVHEQTSPAAAPGDPLPGEKTAEQAADLPVIEGIDTEAALRYTGTTKLFISLLGDFYKLIDLKSSKIEQYLSGGLLRNFTIEVHALKNTARMIGALTLSEGFSRLEQYGHAEDKEALSRETPPVLQQYRNLKRVLQPFGKLGEHDEQDKKAASAAELIAILEKLKAAMNSFNLDDADEALRQLETLQLPDECQAHMQSLRAYMADVAMQEVIDLAQTMIDAVAVRPGENESF